MEYGVELMDAVIVEACTSVSKAKRISKKMDHFLLSFFYIIECQLWALTFVPFVIRVICNSRSLTCGLQIFMFLPLELAYGPAWNREVLFNQGSPPTTSHHNKKKKKKKKTTKKKKGEWNRRKRQTDRGKQYCLDLLWHWIHVQYLSDLAIIYRSITYFPVKYFT